MCLYIHFINYTTVNTTITYTRRPGFLKSLPVLYRAMNSVHGRLAECEQRNGGHLEDVLFRV